MANWAQTVNVIGAIKTSRNHAVLDSVGHLLALYRATSAETWSRCAISAGATVDVRVAALDRAAGARAVSVGDVNFSPKAEDLAVTAEASPGVTETKAAAWRIQRAGTRLDQRTGPTRGGHPDETARAVFGDPSPCHSITVLSIPCGP